MPATARALFRKSAASYGRSQEPQQVEGRDDVEGEIHAEHQEFALGEIDDAHDAEDDPEPDAHQAVDRSQQNACRERLEKNLHEIAERRHCRTMRWRCPCRQVPFLILPG